MLVLFIANSKTTLIAWFANFFKKTKVLAKYFYFELITNLSYFIQIWKISLLALVNDKFASIWLLKDGFKYLNNIILDLILTIFFKLRNVIE